LSFRTNGGLGTAIGFAQSARAVPMPPSAAAKVASAPAVISLTSSALRKSIYIGGAHRFESALFWKLHQIKPNSNHTNIEVFLKVRPIRRPNRAMRRHPWRSGGRVAHRSHAPELRQP
jgi:hypothetical protein